ncbi:hypothetical protein KC319_g22241, partial [Hortaea werneckii]
MFLQCPKLSPLQSRFLASFAALLLLGVVYWSLSNPHFAYAAELKVDGSGQSTIQGNHNWHQTEPEGVADDDLEVTDAWENEGLEKRADAVDSQKISGNNAPNLLNIQAGNTTIWKYTKELLNGEYANETVGLPGKVGQKRVVPPQRHAELRKRQDGETRQIYVSINTCLQPTWNATGMQERAPPQLTLYVATQSDKEDVGPGSGPGQIVRELDEGFA